jgi:hypothetical protein
MNKLVSVLLAVLMAAALFVPAMAAQEADPNLPIVKWVQANQTSAINRIARNGTLALEVAATLPEGSQGKLSYAWYIGDKVVGTGPRLELKIESWMIEETWFSQGGSDAGTVWFPKITVRVVVTNTYMDDNGDERTASDTSGTTISVKPKLLPGVLQALVLVFFVAPLSLAMPLLMLLGLAVELPLMAPGALWSWITGLF